MKKTSRSTGPNSGRSSGRFSSLLAKPRNKFLVFIVLFMVIGAGYMVYRSFAFTELVGADGEFHALAPARILDTRDGTGNVAGPIGAGKTVRVKVSGQGGVAVDSVRAVVLNATVTGPTAANSFLTIWPSGVTRPTASSINYKAGQTVPNLVTVQVGSDGYIQLYNNLGSAHVILDVAGYYSGPQGERGSRFHQINPARILDTRGGAGKSIQPVGPGQTIRATIRGTAAVPDPTANAVVLNVTVLGGAAPNSFLTVWPSGLPRPNASNLNYAAGQVVANQVIVPIGADGQIQIYNNLGSAHVVLDVAGYFADPPNGFADTQDGRFVALSPARILDTRQDSKGPLKQSETRKMKVTGLGGVDFADVKAVVFNATVTDPTATSSFLTIWPGDVVRPNVSNINYSANQTLANQVTVPVDGNGNINLYNNSGSTNLLLDVSGFFIEEQDDSYASGTISAYNSVSNPEIAPSKKAQFDLKINSLPTATAKSNFETTFYTAGWASAGSTIEINTTETGIGFNGGNGYVKFYIKNAEAPLDIVGANPSKEMLYGQYAYHLSFPYNLSAGNTYTVLTEFITDTPGHPGTWQQVSIIDQQSGVKQTFIRLYSGTTASRIVYSPYGLQADFHGSNSCKKPETINWTVGNVQYDVTPATLQMFSIYLNSKKNCPGIARLTPSAGLLTNPQLFTISNGIPQTQRDTTPPIIGAVTLSGKELTVPASDNNGVVIHLDAFINGAQLYPSTVNRDAVTVSSSVFDLSTLTPGNYKLKLKAVDNSNNLSESTQTITVP